MQRTILSILFLFALDLSLADSVSSIRDSQFEWTCETVDGTVISGHTRQDKAFQSCYNAALSDGATYYVRGGTFRVTATIDLTPTPDPDPLPEPEPTPGPDPQSTFGPVTAPVQYDAAISTLAQADFHWRMIVTLNSIGVDQGLVSRDESGTMEPGHLSIRVQADGRVHVRNQSVGSQAVMISGTTLQPGVEYEIEFSLSAGVGMALWINGALEAVDPFAAGLDGNSLPLTLGGLCVTCDALQGPTYPIDGSVYLEIYDLSRLPDMTSSIELQWQNPTQRVDGTPLAPDELVAIRIFEQEQNAMLASVDPDVTTYEVVNLMPNTYLCFFARAVSEYGESDNSNVACKSAP